MAAEGQPKGRRTSVTTEQLEEAAQAGMGRRLTPPPPRSVTTQWQPKGSRMVIDDDVEAVPKGRPKKMPQQIDRMVIDDDVEAVPKGRPKKMPQQIDAAVAEPNPKKLTQPLPKSLGQKRRTTSLLRRWIKMGYQAMAEDEAKEKAKEKAKEPAYELPCYFMPSYFFVRTEAGEVIRMRRIHVRRDMPWCVDNQHN